MAEQRLLDGVVMYSVHITCASATGELTYGVNESVTVIHFVHTLGKYRVRLSGKCYTYAGDVNSNAGYARSLVGKKMKERKRLIFEHVTVSVLGPL